MKNMKFSSSDSDSTSEDEMHTFETDSYAFGWVAVVCNSWMKSSHICNIEDVEDERNKKGFIQVLKTLMTLMWTMISHLQDTFVRALELPLGYEGTDKWRDDMDGMRG